MKRVMFVCKTNSIHSQIAEGFAKHLGVGGLQVASAGLEAGEIHPETIATMDEAGVDIRRQTSKALSEFQPENFDVVIALCGCGRELPLEWVTREGFEEWQFEEAIVQPENFAYLRDEIRSRVIRLVESIDEKCVLQQQNHERAVDTAD